MKVTLEVTRGVGMGLGWRYEVVEMVFFKTRVYYCKEVIMKSKG